MIRWPIWLTQYFNAAVLLQHRRNENIKYLSSGNRTYNLSRLQSHARAPEPRLASISFTFIVENKFYLPIYILQHLEFYFLIFQKLTNKDL